MPTQVMPTRRWGWVYFTLGAAAAIVWARVGGASTDLTDTSGYWLDAVLFLLLAAFVLEPWYAGAGTTITNSLLVIVGSLASGFDSHSGWWIALLVVSLMVFFTMAVSSLLDDTFARQFTAPLHKHVLKLGSWRVLPLGLVVLVVLTFNDVGSVEWSICMATIVYTFAASTFRFEQVRRPSRPHKSIALRAVTAPPDEITLVADVSEASFEVGKVIDVESRFGRVQAAIVAPTVANSIASWILYSPRIRDLLPRRELARDRPHLMVNLSKVKDNDVLVHAAFSRLVSDQGAEIMGISVEGSGIDELVLSVQPDRPLEVGTVCVTYRGAQSVYWQVTDAQVRTSSWSGDPEKQVQVWAVQLGEWDSTTLRFARSIAAPPPVELAMSPERLDAASLGAIDSSGSVRIGAVRGSEFPVAVSPTHLGRHHVAVLGVTGTGKTHLVFSIVDGLVRDGTRVLCADLTGQYAERYIDAPTIHYSELDEFLQDPSKGSVGICDFTTSSENPIIQANLLIRKCFEHVQSLPRLNQAKSARFVIVLEEAHNFIPEAFVIDGWDLKAKSQDTSKIFLEARKFGLGFIVVTQRTAMITKSALSQCGSMFVFRSVDKTGQDYLEGLCGKAMLRALPLLPDRTALAMGRALSSDVPLLMEVDEGVLSID